MFIYFSKPFDIQEPVVFICVVWFFARLESRVPCSPKEELHSLYRSIGVIQDIPVN